MKELKELKYWNNEWTKIFNHYQQDTRFSYYINACLGDNENKILEIGAGSFRDMAQLNKLGLKCYGCDFSPNSVKYAKSLYQEYSDLIYEANAYNLPFEDNFFDISYHNGFWGCFENQEILKLAKEQIRVTKNKIIVGVHNAHNDQFVQYFNKLKIDDPLYSLRFFTIDEITEIFNEFTSDIKIIPVGKQKKYYEDKMINEGRSSRKELKRYFDVSGLKYLENSERLLCIGYL
ncbi:MAG: SAM-dependent methyltransferase [Ignavibacteriales bacterium UTCHB2]|jgi:ubiquinone/menaquinone biosynthesis C-methylase UbiE|nr:MAG: SAM-dependent methyltransferase [Ignavibacteriales bacterium UTCHB2]HQI41286.1 class I SAM-dependent methyltransferase [Ignavibacteriaceae bacterium]